MESEEGVTIDAFLWHRAIQPRITELMSPAAGLARSHGPPAGASSASLLLIL
jgi:hypothetical protein